MNQGFTVTEFAAASLIGLPLLIIGIQIMPGLMKSSETGATAGSVTMLLRGAWDTIRTEARTETGFDMDYTKTAVAFPSPYERYKLSVTDTTTDHFKHLTLTVWYDKNNSGLYDAKETGYQVTGYLTRTAW